MKHSTLTIATTLYALFVTITISCSTPQEHQAKPLRFAIINNTSPDSPYEEYNPQFESTIQSLNQENPVFTVHCGNIVHGGTQTMGTHIKDVEKQYKQFYTYAKKIKSILFTVCGPLDTYNNSPSIYTQFTNKNPWYSFNYGNYHCIVLYTNNSLSISEAQLQWLQKDLKDSYRSPSIIFSYFMPRIRGKQFIHENDKKLHQLLVHHNVVAFFGVEGTTVTIDTIQYISVPCDNSYTNKYKKAIRYYIVDFDGHYFNIVPRYF